MERLLSPRLTYGAPPGSGMFCVPSSDPGQVFSCCKQAAVGLLCPSSCSPSSPRDRLGAKPCCRSAPTHRPPAAAPRSLLATEHPQGSLLSTGKGNHEQIQQEKGETTPHSFISCASLAHPRGVRAHTPPHQADPLLKGFKHQLPREVPLIFVYKGSKQKG